MLLILTWTRWLPAGLLTATLILFQLDRGLSVAEALTAMAVAGIVTVLLELPTSAVADGTGRRRVYLAAAVANVAAGLAFVVAHSFWGFAAAAALFGVFRALDSGPLEAWFVDAVHAHDPGADVDGPLSAQGAVLGVAIALGALSAAGLIWWHPVGDSSPLVLPVLVHAGLTVVHLVATVVLFREPSGPRDAGALDAPSAAVRSWRALRANRRFTWDCSGVSGFRAVGPRWCSSSRRGTGVAGGVWPRTSSCPCR